MSKKNIPSFIRQKNEREGIAVDALGFELRLGQNGVPVSHATPDYDFENESKRRNDNVHAVLSDGATNRRDAESIRAAIFRLRKNDTAQSKDCGSVRPLLRLRNPPRRYAPHGIGYAGAELLHQLRTGCVDAIL